MSAKPSEIFSHWNTMIQGLDASPKEFLRRVEQVVREKNLQDVRYSDIEFREGGLMSAKRRYLRVQRKRLSFDVCGAPFGNGFFVSWWLGELPSLLVRVLGMIPGINLLVYWYLQVFKTQTYYKYDTAQMYQTLVHSAVLEVVDEYTKAKGLHAISENARTPVVKDFLRD